ncbi:MAG: hypothetical protein IAF02_21615, partial [Anaerolineae bacterium]|nr:hypothetical protein [Anaerolineae bacterium]
IGRPVDLRQQLQPQRRYLLKVDRLDTATEPAESATEPAESATEPVESVTELAEVSVSTSSTAVSSELLALQSTMQLDQVRHEIVFWGSEEDGLLTAVLDILRRHNIHIQSITATPPSLEEVFAHYTKKEEG